MRSLPPIQRTLRIAIPAALAAAAVLVLLTGATLQDPDPGPDSRYWTYDEVLAKLAQWEVQYPNIFHREIIGYTGEFHEAIWAVKISDNAATPEPEARVMIVAAIHANESNGVGAIMYMMDRLLTRYGQVSYYTQMVDNLEMWFVPVVNVDGYRYVLGGGAHWDLWRKSMRDNNGDHLYTYPIDGVDCNRNWDYRWAEYDSTQWISSRYKGPYPFSENCIVCYRDLLLRENPVFSQNLHSPDVPSSGNKNWYCWYDPITYQNGPDVNIYRPISQTLGNRTQTENTGVYVNGNVASYNDTPKEQCWIYANTGICTFVMEISLQYWWTGAMVDTIAARFGRGQLYLMERALSGPGLTGFVTAAHTGLPVEAEIVVQQVHSPSIGPRMTDGYHGRYWRLLTAGNYTVTASAEDFISQTHSVYVSASGWTQLDFQLQPDPAAVGEVEPQERMLWFDSPMHSNRRIHFRLDEVGDVTLDVLDVSGRVAARLFDGRMPAGDHSVVLERGLPAGSYFVRMRTGGEQQVTRKLLILE
jgi:hypothetical protein